MKVADRWFVRTTIDDAVTRLVEPHVHRVMHPVGAAQMNPYRAQMHLRWSAFEPGMIDAARSVGYEIDRDEMIDELRRPGFDVDAFHPGARPELRSGSAGPVGDGLSHRSA